jgi:hypothetical protein
MKIAGTGTKDKLLLKVVSFRYRHLIYTIDTPLFVQRPVKQEDPLSSLLSGDMTEPLYIQHYSDYSRPYFFTNKHYS